MLLHYSIPGDRSEVVMEITFDITLVFVMWLSFDFGGYRLLLRLLFYRLLLGFFLQGFVVGLG
jgi:hypothetical protein